MSLGQKAIFLITLCLPGIPVVSSGKVILPFLTLLLSSCCCLHCITGPLGGLAASQLKDGCSRHGQLSIIHKGSSCSSISKLWLSVTRLPALRALSSTQSFTQVKGFIQYTSNPSKIQGFFISPHIFCLSFILYDCVLTLYELLGHINPSNMLC